MADRRHRHDDRPDPRNGDPVKGITIALGLSLAMWAVIAGAFYAGWKAVELTTPNLATEETSQPAPQSPSDPKSTPGPSDHSSTAADPRGTPPGTRDRSTREAKCPGDQAQTKSLPTHPVPGCGTGDTSGQNRPASRVSPSLRRLPVALESRHAPTERSDQPNPHRKEQT